ncbi:hypothetical protein DPEC_G00254080 [Dallia pectoralis]|uniref:Uncharacterized protein n=1 Tax=Dallia pectoralis TaxID=75939 RepID=A0ACC2FTY8_DALPE|nr:hypothetical protein DPEC_G00254080 [Dallia pectoralis]
MHTGKYEELRFGDICWVRCAVTGWALHTAPGPRGERRSTPPAFLPSQVKSDDNIIPVCLPSTRPPRSPPTPSPTPPRHTNSDGHMGEGVEPPPSPPPLGYARPPP